MTEEDLRLRLREAERTLAEQSMELNRIRAAAGGDAEGLIAATAAAGADASNEAHQDLLKLIVRTAATVLDSEAASLFVVDVEREVLVFQVAVGGAGDMLQSQTIALGTGVVGFVAATGTPLVVNSAREDPRFAAGFAQSTGYVPENLLAVPMVDDGEVAGVLEVLNKRRGQEKYSQRDIEVLSMFAQQAAVAFRRSAAGTEMLDALRASLEGEQGAGSGRAAAEFAVKMSSLIVSIGRRGPLERRLLVGLVEALAGYLDEKDKPEL